MSSHCLSRFRYCPCCGSDQFSVFDDRSKRCAECGFVFYLNASAATVALIRNPKGELLVVRRARHPGKGLLTLPGGFVDHGESIEEGCLREVREEVGVSGRIVRFLFSLPNRYPFSDFIVPTVDSFFEVAIDNPAAIVAGDDAEAAFWRAPEDLPLSSFAMSSVREGLARWLEEERRKTNTSSVPTSS